MCESRSGAPQPPVSAEVRPAPHAAGLREPPPARSSAGNPGLATGGRPRAPRFPDGRTDGRLAGRQEPRAGRDAGGREARRKRWGEEREGGRGRIGSLSSTGTTELSCHGEGGAAGRA